MNKRFRRVYQIPEELDKKGQIHCREINRRELFADFSLEIEPDITYLIKLESEMTHYENTFTKKISDTIWVYDKVTIDDLLRGSKKALEALLRISNQYDITAEEPIELLGKAISKIESGEAE